MWRDDDPGVRFGYATSRLNSQPRGDWSLGLAEAWIPGQMPLVDSPMRYDAHTHQETIGKGKGNVLKQFTYPYAGRMDMELERRLFERPDLSLPLFCNNEVCPH